MEELHTQKGTNDRTLTTERYPEVLAKKPVSVEDIVIGNTGASCHLFHNNDGMEAFTEIKEKVAGISGNNMLASLKGKERLKFKQANGTFKERLLYPVKFVKD